jgi:ABC-type Fe3+/spermidine/putrescine transport system ATPase subunit
VYKNPVNEYAAGLLGNYNLIKQETITKYNALQASKDNFVRPEHILITEKAEDTMEGKIIAQRFMGSYYEIDIAIGDATFVIHADALQKLDETVFAKFFNTKSK